MIDHRRLVAPREQLAVLVEPAASELAAALQAARPWPHSNAVILDSTAGALRESLRQRLGLTGPLILTGHQAEFFHPGVFAKNIAAHVLAQSSGGTAAFVDVDSDVAKVDHLCVPQATAGGLRRIDVAVPGCDKHLPVESQPPMPRELWLDFFTRIAALLDDYPASLLKPFVDGWLATEELALEFAAAMSRGRRAAEESLGLHGVADLRMSSLSETPEFRAFAAHIVLNAAGFAARYNQAQADYRRRHGIRSRHRPVPPLTIDGERIETPFWISHPDQPRQRLYVIRRGEHLELFADERPVATLDIASINRAERLVRGWPGMPNDWRIRPRALALSAFARLILADLFIHGIGGARYDEMTEQFAEAFWGHRPAPMACVTATVYLPLKLDQPADEGLAEARRRSRDIRYNPQRYVRNPPAELLKRREELIGRSTVLQAAYAGEPSERAARRTVYTEIRTLNERILANDPWRAAELEQQVERLEQRRRVEAIALDREYFFGLQPRSLMATLVQRVRAAVGRQGR